MSTTTGLRLLSGILNIHIKDTDGASQSSSNQLLGV
jgi:hypothetical protein